MPKLVLLYLGQKFERQVMTCTYYKMLFIMLGIHIFSFACGGQKELVQLVQKNQEALKQCQQEANESTVKAQVSLERQKDLKNEVKQLRDAFLLEQDRWRDQAKSLSRTRSSSPTIPANNLRELNPEQIIVMVRAVGGDIKRFGNRLMAIFGKIKTQIVYTRKDRVLTAHARFKGYSNDLKFINDWNRTKRFSRAYIDKDKDIVLEAEIDLEPGVSEEAIKNWLKGFGVILNFFQHSLVKQAGSKGSKEKSKKIERHRI